MEKGFSPESLLRPSLAPSKIFLLSRVFVFEEDEEVLPVDRDDEGDQIPIHCNLEPSTKLGSGEKIVKDQLEKELLQNSTGPN